MCKGLSVYATSGTATHILIVRFFATLNDRRVFRKVKLIVYTIPYNLICGTEGM